MRQSICSLVFGALALTAVSTASARVDIDVGIAPFGYAPPPVVYQPDSYYVAPPVIYFGGGHWGGDRDRDHHHERHERGWHH
jgi:hypothetical protein